MILHLPLLFAWLWAWRQHPVLVTALTICLYQLPK